MKNKTTTLHRPSSGRVIAGVARGLADRLDLPVWLVRLGFVIATFLGGSGIPLYAAGWLAIPAEGADRSIAGEWIQRSDSPNRRLGLTVIVVGLLTLLVGLGAPGGAVLAVVLLVGGIVMYRGELSSGGSA